MKQINVYKGRTNVIPVSLGKDVSEATIVSEIRTDESRGSTLIATWDVTFTRDGTDGEIILTLDDSVVNAITRSVGWMDIKIIIDGEPFPAFDESLQVLFKEVVTA